MGAKIGSVLIAALMIALCAIPAAAEEVSIFSSTSDDDFRGVFGTTVQRTSDSGGIHASRVNADSNNPFFAFGRRALERVDDTSNRLSYIKGGYTYSIRVVLQVDWYNYQSSRPPDQDVYINDMANIYIPYMNELVSRNAFCPMVIPVSSFDQFDFSPVSDDSYVSGLVASTHGIVSSSSDGFGLRVNYIYDIAFSTPSDLQADYFDGIGFAQELPKVGDIVDLSGYNGTYYFYFTLKVQSFSYTGVYDESGAILESETDRIIAGQKEAILEGQEYERQEVNQSGSDAQDDASAAAENAFDNTSFLNGVTMVYDGISYSGTDFQFTFPASGDIPFLGNLWDSQDIPFKYYIDSLPPLVLVIIRFILFLGAIFVLLWCVKILLKILNKGSEK